MLDILMFSLLLTKKKETNNYEMDSHDIGKNCQRLSGKTSFVEPTTKDSHDIAPLCTAEILTTPNKHKPPSRLRH